MTKAKAKQVFISHAKEDTQFAHRLADDLRRLGVQVWIAPGSIRPGESWVDAIERGLSESSHTVVVLTPNALKSRWVKKETGVAIAQERKGRIQVIPLDVEPCAVPLLLSSYQMVSFRYEYDAGLSQLADILGVHITPPESVHPPLVEPVAVPMKEAIRFWRKVPLWGWGAVGGLVLLAVVGGVLLKTRGAKPVPTPTSAAEVTSPAVVVSPTVPATTPVPATATPIAPTPTSIPPTATPTRQPTPTPTPKPVAVVEAEALNVRGGPGTEYDVLGQVKQGDELEIVARTEGSDWLQVRLADGREGWVSARLVEVSGKVTGIPVATVIPPTPPPGMVYVPAGEFIMGNDVGDDDEKPTHTVTLRAFEIDMFEVTNADFAKFVEDTGYQTEAEKSGEAGWRAHAEGKDNHPVVKVTWNDADAYCRWAGKRLPTEAEWEKAARGIKGFTYPWANWWDPTKANTRESGLMGTVAVGSFAEGASPYGVFDMAGNVWEWVADWYQPYPGSTYHSEYFGEKFKVTRGGGWFQKADLVTTSNRSATDPTAANDDLGFRCAR